MAYGKKIRVTWNGILYHSLTQASKACGITIRAMKQRLENGYTCDDDLTSKETPVTWNGSHYSSLKEAADANNVSSGAMSKRLKKGYTCDSDVKKRGRPQDSNNEVNDNN